MKSIKDLQDKRASLFKQGQSIIDSAKDGEEIRSLNDDEQSKAEGIQEEIRQLDEEIAEEKRNRDSKDAIVET